MDAKAGLKGAIHRARVSVDSCSMQIQSFPLNPRTTSLAAMRDVGREYFALRRAMDELEERMSGLVWGNPVEDSVPDDLVPVENQIELV